MTFEEFTASLAKPQPADYVNPILKGLWYDAKDDWEAAHTIAQSREGTPAYDRLHAYLHRKEGDRFNAAYWYRRAGTTFFNGTLEDEWQVLVEQMLHS